MKIESFLNEYNKTDENNRCDFIKSHVNNKYIPIEMKQTLAKNVIKSSFYIKNNDGSYRFYVNSIAKHMLTCMTMLDTYTDIERDKNGNILDEYNKLNKVRFFDFLYESIDSAELKEFNMVLDMEEKDFIMNEYEPGAFIRNQVERFGNLIGTTLLPLIENIDMSKVEELLKQYMVNLKGE